VTYFIIYNKASGEQAYYTLDDVSGTYDINDGTLVWDEIADGNAINDIGAAYNDLQLVDNIGKFTRQTSPSLHLLQGGYIAGHVAAVEAAYDKVIKTFALKFELEDRSLLTSIGSAVTATYAAHPLNKVRWEQKKNVKAKGRIWDIIKAELSYTNAQMIELWDAAEANWDESED
jgi:hypothetical protein